MKVASDEKSLPKATVNGVDNASANAPETSDPKTSKVISISSEAETGPQLIELVKQLDKKWAETAAQLQEKIEGLESIIKAANPGVFPASSSPSTSSGPTLLPAQAPTPPVVAAPTTPAPANTTSTTTTTPTAVTTPTVVVSSSTTTPVDTKPLPPPSETPVERLPPLSSLEIDEEIVVPESFSAKSWESRPEWDKLSVERLEEVAQARVRNVMNKVTLSSTPSAIAQAFFQSSPEIPSAWYLLEVERNKERNLRSNTWRNHKRLGFKNQFNLMVHIPQILSELVKIYDGEPIPSQFFDEIIYYDWKSHMVEEEKKKGSIKALAEPTLPNDVNLNKYISNRLCPRKRQGSKECAETMLQARKSATDEEVKYLRSETLGAKYTPVKSTGKRSRAEMNGSSSTPPTALPVPASAASASSTTDASGDVAMSTSPSPPSNLKQKANGNKKKKLANGQTASI